MERIILLAVSLALLPALYLALCHWMEQTIRDPPRMAFFLIFGSIGGYLLLCALLMPSPVGAVVVGAFLLAAYPAHFLVLVSTLKAQPRTAFHLAAAGISGLVVAAPILMVIASALP